jgi:dipeptidyl aminopeptidase/acylaminoacyl peptidase
LRGKRRFLRIVLLSSLIFLPRSARRAEKAVFEGRIAFLRDGEIWVADQDGGNASRVTDTDGKVEDFLFSPSLGYVAYSRRIKTVEEPGLWEDWETPPQRSVCSIVVLELEGLRPRGELVPPEGEWIYPNKWIPEERLFGHRASGFDVSGFFAFDARKGLQSDLDYSQGARLLEADFTPDGSLQAYVQDSGVGKDFKISLYLVNLRTKAEKLLLAKRSVLSPKISPDKARIAFFEVEYLEKKGFDTLWVYDIEKDRFEKLYHGPSKPKFGGVSDLAWSPDGRHIAIFFPSETRVLEVSDPAHVHSIPGNDCSWVSNDMVIYCRENRVYSYRLGTRKSNLLLESASKPVFLAPY